MSTPTTLRPLPSYADFVSKVDDLYDHLEELHYVDQVLDHLDVIEANRELQVLDNLTLQQAHYTVHLGRTHPFTREVPLLVPQIVLKQKMADARSSASVWASAARRAALHAIDPWIASYGHYFETAHTTVVRARDELMFVSDDFAKLGHSLSDWKGTAADDFDSNFYKPADHIRDRQMYALEAMRCAIVFADGLTNLSKHSVMNALEAADSCAVKQLEARARNDRATASESLTILALATGILSAATFPVAPVSAGFSAASAALGYAASGLESEKDRTETTIAAASADDVDAQLHSVVTSVRTRSQEHYGELERRLQATHQNIADFEKEDLWFTRAPRIVTDPDPSEFVHESRRPHV